MLRKQTGPDLCVGSAAVSKRYLPMGRKPLALRLVRARKYGLRSFKDVQKYQNPV
jgi:hypothetical protein